MTDEEKAENEMIQDIEKLKQTIKSVKKSKETINGDQKHANAVAEIFASQIVKKLMMENISFLGLQMILFLLILDNVLMSLQMSYPHLYFYSEFSLILLIYFDYFFALSQIIIHNLCKLSYFYVRHCFPFNSLTAPVYLR